MCAMWQGWTLALRNVVSELLNQGMGYTIESRCLLPLSPPPPSTVCFIYPHQRIHSKLSQSNGLEGRLIERRKKWFIAAMDSWMRQCSMKVFRPCGCCSSLSHFHSASLSCLPPLMADGCPPLSLVLLEVSSC